MARHKDTSVSPSMHYKQAFFLQFIQKETKICIQKYFIVKISFQITCKIIFNKISIIINLEEIN